MQRAVGNMGAADRDTVGQHPLGSALHQFRHVSAIQSRLHNPVGSCALQ